VQAVRLTKLRHLVNVEAGRVDVPDDALGTVRPLIGRVQSDQPLRNARVDCVNFVFEYERLELFEV
jgi:hypothetical protein